MAAGREDSEAWVSDGFTMALVHLERVARRDSRHRLVSAAALSIALLLGGAACGTDTPAPSGQPAGSDGAFVPADFAQLPTPEAAVPYGDPVVDGDNVTQSFHVTGAPPEDVISFYDSSMAAAGWKPAVASAEVGDGDWQSQWARRDETLLVTASVDDDNGHDPDGSQLDLILTTG